MRAGVDGEYCRSLNSTKYGKTRAKHLSGDAQVHFRITQYAGRTTPLTQHYRELCEDKEGAKE